MDEMRIAICGQILPSWRPAISWHAPRNSPQKSVRAQSLLRANTEAISESDQKYKRRQMRAPGLISAYDRGAACLRRRYWVDCTFRDARPTIPRPDRAGHFSPTTDHGRKSG